MRNATITPEQVLLLAQGLRHHVHLLGLLKQAFEHLPQSKLKSQASTAIYDTNAIVTNMGMVLEPLIKQLDKEDPQAKSIIEWFQQQAKNHKQAQQTPSEALAYECETTKDTAQDDRVMRLEIFHALKAKSLALDALLILAQNVDMSKAGDFNLYDVAINSITNAYTELYDKIIELDEMVSQGGKL